MHTRIGGGGGVTCATSPCDLPCTPDFMLGGVKPQISPVRALKLTFATQHTYPRPLHFLPCECPFLPVHSSASLSSTRNC